MKRGLLCWVNLEPAAPPEFGKTRPAVVISNTGQNISLPTVVVLPLSSRAPEIWPLRLEVTTGKGRKSYAVVPGIRQIDKARIVDTIGDATVSDMARIEEAVSAYLSD